MVKIEKSDDGKPKFIELHKYPGYSSLYPTPLPHDLPTIDILSLVVKAHPRIHRAPKYRPVFENLFYSQMSQHIIQDMFWWYFLQRYSPLPSVQSKLFSRTSNNYMSLLRSSEQTQFKDTFLKEYPDLIAQSIYCAFCRAFPDSYQHFTDTFRDQILYLAYEWLVGTHPAPLTWTRWNLKVIEPPSMRVKQEILQKEEKQYEGYRKPINTGPIIDFSSVEQAASLVSNSSRNTSQRESLQFAPRPRASFAAPRPRQSLESVSVKNDRSKDRMTPISEREEKEDESGLRQGRNALSRPYNPPSHIVGSGAQFRGVAFNIYGRSPLIQQYLRSQKAEKATGANVYMQRREISQAVPLQGETYHDLVVNQFIRRRKNNKTFQKSWDLASQQWRSFENKSLKERKEFERKEASLLGQRDEVKRLSDLLMLDAQRDADSISALATEELQVALLRQGPDRGKKWLVG